MKFSIIAAIDENNGIGKNGNIPWLNTYNDLSYFKEITLNCESKSRENVIIMGKNTWNSLPEKPLPNRINIIISSTLESSCNYNVYSSLDKALKSLINIYEKINLIYIIGGQELYKEAISHPKCDKLYITQIPGIYECDKFFPKINNDIYTKNESTFSNSLTYNIYHKTKQINMEEYQYLNLIKNVIRNGTLKEDRTGIGTMSIFGSQMRFNLENNTIPLLTTKRVFSRGIIEELLWFINGSTDSNKLAEKKVKIWDPNGSREFLDSLGFTDREIGDLGPIYGFQWRHWGAKYVDKNTDYTDKGFDQLQNVIDQIKTNPNSRRIILSGWNVLDIPKMALPPCHVLCQFYVVKDKLSAQLYQRSGDIGLGVPFNIASYSILLIMIAHITGYKPYEFIYTLGDAHIYNNHIDALKNQIYRIPRDFPKLNFKRKIEDINDFRYDDFTISGYEPCKVIKMEMAV